MTKRNINLQALDQHLKDTGQIFSLMQELGGLYDDEGRGQPCPFCGGEDRLWYSEKYGVCYCRNCKPNGKGYDLYVLTMHHQGNVSLTEAAELVATRSGFVDSESDPKANAPKAKVQHNKRQTPYDYTDEHGEFQYRVTRTDFSDENGNPDKEFFIQHVGKDGKVIYRRPAVSYPYLLSDVLEAEVVAIVEGEKVATLLNQALRSAGKNNVVATTSHGGSNQWKLWKGFLERFPSIADKMIILLPDNDNTGRTFMLEIASTFLKANPMASVKIADLVGLQPNLPKGGDFEDWYAGQEQDIETLFAFFDSIELVTRDSIATWNQSESENIGIDIPVSQDKPTTPDIVLHPKMPLMSADKFIEAHYTTNGMSTLIYYADDYWRWDGNAYRKIEVGEVRKGTVGRILQKVVGIHNTASPSTQAFGQNFGLQPLIGKTSAVVYDARFEKGSSRIIERVLNITGEDSLTIDRKNRNALTIRLQTKLMFISNEVPNVIDQSGAFASRFIFLKLPNDFRGREDLDLEGKLSTELPGILRLAIQHLQVLLDRGCFIQPESGKGLSERMMALSSPVGEFMKQLSPGMSREDIWNQWCNARRDEGQNPGTKDELWNNLESAGFIGDFAKSDLLAKIREHGGESTVRKLQDSFAEYHTEGGADRLKQLLGEMVAAGILTDRCEPARNGKKVVYYRIPGEKLGDPYDEYC